MGRPEACARAAHALCFGKKLGAECMWDLRLLSHQRFQISGFNRKANQYKGTKARFPQRVAAFIYAPQEHSKHDHHLLPYFIKASIFEFSSH